VTEDERSEAVARLRLQTLTPLPRHQLLTARDLAHLVHVDVNTIYVWASRGTLRNRAGRYDWREAALWLLTRDVGKISEPAATREAM
jgi:hypothetical protein